LDLNTQVGEGFGYGCRENIVESALYVQECSKCVFLVIE